MYPKFKFEMDIPIRPTSEMIKGKLFLRDENTNIMFQATSGLPGYQYFGAWRLPRRGLLPPTAAISRKYEVSTNRLWMPNVTGVQGSFWGITPFTVDLDGVTRGDFGIHFDHNVPGSAGCIVVDLQDHFDKFKGMMEEYNQMRIKSIPLEVLYI